MTNNSVHSIAEPIVEGNVVYQEISPIVGEGKNTSISQYPWDFSFDEKNNTYTSSWNNGKHAGTFTKGNYLYDNVTDALSKWQSGNANIPYFAVNTSQGIKYYKILSQRPAAQTTDGSTKAEKQIINASTPIQRKTALSKRNTTKQYTPITGEVANYLSYVSGGVPYFILPEGYTDNDFQEALQRVFKSNPDLQEMKMGTYQDTSPTQEQTQEQTQEHDSNTVPVRNKKPSAPKKQVHQSEKVEANSTRPVNYLDKSYYLYAYPHNNVHIYSIHPDIYEKVLEDLKSQQPSGKKVSRTSEYYLTTTPLSKVPIGGQVNDSIYHFINNRGLDDYVTIPAVENPNLVSSGDLIISNAADSNGNIQYSGAPILMDKDIKNGKIQAYTIDGPTGQLLYSPGVGINSRQPMTYVKDLIQNSKKVPREMFQSLAESWGYTAEQLADRFYKKTKSYYTNQPEYSFFLYKDVPQENIITDYKKPYEQQTGTEKQISDVKRVVSSFQEQARKGVNKVKSWLGFREGGTINYLNYFK